MAANLKCVMIYPTENSAVDLNNFATNLGLDIGTDFAGNPCDDFEFHLTLFISRELIEYPNFTYFLPAKITLHGHTLMRLGDRATVLEMGGDPNLTHIRDSVMREMKATSTWPDFIPHVSLSYNPAHSLVLPMGAYLPVTFDRMKVKDFVPD